MKAIKCQGMQIIKKPYEELVITLENIINDMEINRILKGLKGGSEKFLESEEKKGVLKQKGEQKQMHGKYHSIETR